MSSEDEINIGQGGQARPSNAKARVASRKKRAAVGQPGPSVGAAEKPASKKAATAQHISDDDDEILALDEPPNAKPSKAKAPAKATSTSSAKDTKAPEMTVSKPKPGKKVFVSEDTTSSRDGRIIDGTQIPSSTSHTNQGNGPNKSHNTTDTVSRKELERWKQRVIDLETQRDALQEQFNELLRLRSTEPERELEEVRLLYEERAKTQDAHIKELSLQLARIEPLARSAHNGTLHFLTREVADEEKSVLEQDIAGLHDVVKQKNATITEQSRRITELEQLVDVVTRERDAEIERSKEILARAAPRTAATSRSHQRLGTEDSRVGEVVKFYEDMSNLLVTNVRFELAPDSDEKEIIFHCIYTYFEMTRRDDDIEGERLNEKSVDFTMRIFSGYGGPNGEPMNDDDFIHRRIQYTPLHLDKEPESFVKGLSYMGEPFTFPCSQQGLFLNSLRERIVDAIRGDEGGDDDVDIQEVG